MADSTASGRKLAGLELEHEVVRLRIAGATYENIGKKLGCSTGGAQRACVRALRRSIEHLRESVDELVEMEDQRLDQMLLVLWPKVLEGNLSAMDRALKIMDRRAALRGVDAPKRVVGADGQTPIKILIGIDPDDA